MSFKLIKEWFFCGIKKSRKRHGEVTVTSEGELIVVVRFEPSTALVTFKDPDPPIDPCNPHAPDSLDASILFLGHGRWGVKIVWSVFSVRHVKYQIEGQLK